MLMRFLPSRFLVAAFLVCAFGLSSAYAAQCAATTQKGTQCKRSAAAGSTYCWQHGGSSSSSTSGRDRTPSTPTPPTPPAADASTPKALPVEDGSSIIVYVTDTGEKYHREGCQYLRNGSRLITLKAALAAHTPCSVCKPPTLGESPKPPTVGPSDKGAFPSTGPIVKKVFVLKDGRSIRAVLITDNDGAYVLKDAEGKFHEVAKDDVAQIQNP